MTAPLASAPTALVRPMRRALAVGYAASLAALVVAGGVSYAVAGTEGLWGAVLGIAVPVAFLSVTGLVALATARMGTSALGATVLGSWLVKLIVLIAFLAAIRDATFYDRKVFFVVFLVAIIGYLVLEAVVVVRTRVPYVEPAPARGVTGRGPGG